LGRRWSRSSSEDQPYADDDEQPREGQRQRASGDALLQIGPEQRSADRGNAHERRVPRAHLAARRVEDGASRRGDEDRAERGGGGGVRGERGQRDQQRDDDDAAADPEEGGEDAGDEADQRQASGHGTPFAAQRSYPGRRCPTTRSVCSPRSPSRPPSCSTSTARSHPSPTGRMTRTYRRRRETSSRGSPRGTRWSPA